jgi:hypothetical protein
MKIRLVGVDMFHAGERTNRREDRHDEANGCFFHSFVNAPQNQPALTWQNLYHIICDKS